MTSPLILKVLVIVFHRVSALKKCFPNISYVFASNPSLKSPLPLTENAHMVVWRWHASQSQRVVLSVAMLMYSRMSIYCREVFFFSNSSPLISGLCYLFSPDFQRIKSHPVIEKRAKPQCQMWAIAIQSTMTPSEAGHRQSPKSFNFTLTFGAPMGLGPLGGGLLCLSLCPAVILTSG